MEIFPEWNEFQYKNMCFLVIFSNDDRFRCYSKIVKSLLHQVLLHRKQKMLHNILMSISERGKMNTWCWLSIVICPICIGMSFQNCIFRWLWKSTFFKAIHKSLHAVNWYLLRKLIENLIKSHQEFHIKCTQ